MTDEERRQVIGELKAAEAAADHAGIEGINPIDYDDFPTENLAKRIRTIQERIEKAGERTDFWNQEE